MNSLCCAIGFYDATESHEGFDRVLGIVIIPRNTIPIEKSKKLFTRFLKSLFVSGCNRGLIGSPGEISIEASDRLLMFVQITSPQTETINCFHHRPQKSCETVGDFYHFFVIRLPQHIFVNVSKQMN